MAGRSRRISRVIHEIPRFARNDGYPMSKPLINGPIVLVILDGFGIAPEGGANPVDLKVLPEYSRLCAESRHTRLWAHGEYVGLPEDQDGNSEAGHLNLGAGRIVKQDPSIINDSIRDGTFFKNPAFSEAIRHVKQNNSRLHLMGMLSNGQSAHSTPEHLYALLDLLDKEKVASVFLHLFTDGRDSHPFSGKTMVERLLRELRPNQRIASIIGRFYAMDRRKSWARTEKAYNAIVLGEGRCVNDPLTAFDESYREGVGDEFIEPYSICHEDKPIGDIQDNDAIIFFNHRSDRARQLAKPFVQENFNKDNPGSFIPKRIVKNLRFVAMTDFGPDLDDIITAYPSVLLKDTLPMVLSKKRQLYLAESEKYAHMTYFFNGGYADPVNGEDRLMVPSPDVERYDQAPAMATRELADEVIKDLADKKYDFIVVNLACPDMVAHTGNLSAAKIALQAVDQNLGRLMEAVGPTGGALIVTADHGNIEEMKDFSSGAVDTEHSKNQVPFLLWLGTDGAKNLPPLRHGGVLADVGPTILDLFGVSKPVAMTGKSLFEELNLKS